MPDIVRGVVHSRRTPSGAAWFGVLRDLFVQGKQVEIPGATKGFTKEILFKTGAFDMNYPIFDHPARETSFKFLAAEALFITSGDNRVENIAPYNKMMEKFSDDGFILNGAYGPPFNEQLMYAVNSLLSDDSSRQAVISIWKPNPVKSKDIRCTLTLQFIIRDGELNTQVNMRSSDAIWGLTYDWPVFTFMTLRVLTMLNETLAETFDSGHKAIKLGTMAWTAGSSHYYDRHAEMVSEVMSCGNEVVSYEIPEELTLSWKACVDYLTEMRETNKVPK